MVNFQINTEDEDPNTGVQYYNESVVFRVYHTFKRHNVSDQKIIAIMNELKADNIYFTEEAEMNKRDQALKFLEKTSASGIFTVYTALRKFGLSHIDCQVAISIMLYDGVIIQNSDIKPRESSALRYENDVWIKINESIRKHKV